MKRVTIIFLLIPLFSFAQPRLIVGIMVDGLQQRHVEQLSDRFGTGGIKKLTSQGAAFSRITCNTLSAGNASDIATLTSGTVPYYHGVVSNQVYNRLTDKIESIFLDQHQSGIESHLKLSAKNLRATTFIDELMIRSEERRVGKECR